MAADVVEVKDHARLQPRQHVENEEVHVPADSDCVSGIDEQDVSALELFE